MATVSSRGEVRGTQSLVQTMSAVWKRPLLTGLEVLWRWVFGIPACLVCWIQFQRIVHRSHVDIAALQRMTVFDPAGAATTLSDAASAVLPSILAVLAWLAPILLLAWAVESSLGRILLIRRLRGRVYWRPFTLMVLNGLRAAALAGSFAGWIWCVSSAAHVAIGTGKEPDLVLYCALVIIATLGIFLLWSVVSWIFSIAPLLAAVKGYSVGGSLIAATRAGKASSKLIEINLVMGIVKIALLVLALAFSACPLPFKSVATPQFMMQWYAFVAVLYLLASDYFHVVRVAAYLEMWSAYPQAEI